MSKTWTTNYDKLGDGISLLADLEERSGMNASTCASGQRACRQRPVNCLLQPTPPPWRDAIRRGFTAALML